jgi:single-strand DNA-binding protein
LNKVIFLGNLTRDVELKYVGEDQKPLAKFAIAVNEYRQGVECDAMFIDVTVFGRTAETANQYLAKGRKVVIAGKLVLERWTSQDGNPRSKHTVKATEVFFVDNPRSPSEENNDENG